MFLSIYEGLNFAYYLMFSKPPFISHNLRLSIGLGDTTVFQVVNYKTHASQHIVSESVSVTFPFPIASIVAYAHANASVECTFTYLTIIFETTLLT